MSGTLVLIAGKDPLGDDAGHSSYVRAHALAARGAGYRPYLLCLGRSPAVTEAAIGTLVRIGSRVRPVRHLMMPVLSPIVARGIARLVRSRPDPVLAHSFAVWSHPAARGCAALRDEGRSARAIVSTYATHPSEIRSSCSAWPVSHSAPASPTAPRRCGRAP